MLRYFLFYKPYQVLTQFSAEGEKKTLAHYFKNIPRDIYPVGRLDFDSEGLLLLTNDKKLTQQLLEPRYKHRRTYYVQVEGIADVNSIKNLEEGVTINVDGKLYKTLKAEATILTEEPQLPERFPPIRFRKNIPTTWCALTLEEGKNRQVRKMTAAVGLPTLRLVRYSIGNVTVDGMESGEIKEVSAEIIPDLLDKTKR
jgi:23S rRNA pseudouridine2457 synthase